MAFEIESGLVGGCAYDAHGKAISEGRHGKAQAADAVMFGAVGGRNGTACPMTAPRGRPAAPAQGSRPVRQPAPAICYPALADASSLKRELVEGLDILIVRELTGGVYFGEPKEITDLGNGQKRAIDTQVYDTYEIERIARVAFELARTRATRSPRWRSATS
jgi:3-isopropylmalate dehydrogenase